MKNAVSNNSSDFVEGQITHCATKVIEESKHKGGRGGGGGNHHNFWKKDVLSSLPPALSINLEICPENTMPHLHPERLEEHTITEGSPLCVPLLVRLIWDLYGGKNHGICNISSQAG